MHSTCHTLARMLAFRQFNTCRPCNNRAVPWTALSLKLYSAVSPLETEPNTMESPISNSTASTSEAQYTDTDAAPVRNGQLQPGLYLVGTPIGNLEDITLRALRVLREADVILAEDTRHSRKLLTHFGIEGQLVLEMLQRRSSVALVSDAGMPLISDPGGSLVKAVAERGFSVFPVPGPSAVLSALVASGLPAQTFLFCGFLPPKSAARLTAIKGYAGMSATLIFFAPPHSIQHVLADLAQVLGGLRQCAVARELTKVHEEFWRGTLEGAAAEFSSRTPKGEFTVVVEGSVAEELSVSHEEIEERLRLLLAEGCSPSSAAKSLSKNLNLPRNTVYAIALKLKD